MKITKQQLRQMACVISGGHRYADTDLLLAVDTKKKVCEYSNRCVKCGKEYHVEVPLQYVLPENLTDTYRNRVECENCANCSSWDGYCGLGNNEEARDRGVCERWESK
jgi:hypothetical protein